MTTDVATLADALLTARLVEREAEEAYFHALDQGNRLQFAGDLFAYTAHVQGPVTEAHSALHARQTERAKARIDLLAAVCGVSTEEAKRL